MDKEEQLQLVKKDPYNIRYIKNPDREVQLEAIKDLNIFKIYPGLKKCITDPEVRAKLEKRLKITEILNG